MGLLAYFVPDRLLLEMNVYQQALQLDSEGDWQEAHELVQDLSTKEAAWVHAYLHRKEGDEFNAGYWYRKAGKITPALSLQEEWLVLWQALSNRE